MAGTPLRSYVREVEKHIESGRNDEAIAHCRYILEAYPKYTDTYRLLGKAFLESQRYGDAADIFQRVLSSIPDDFVSHVGMSIVREDEGNLDEAIWHMERAFEIQPANSAIQDELRRLYGRRDGVEPPKIRLTRGALARMYYKGGLYQQAIAETRSALAENSNRLDLQVLLAEIYAKTGQRAEAADTANSILKKIPYCLTANQILATSLSGTDRDQEAQVFRQRLNKLDPYSVFIGPNNPNSTSVPDQAITIEKLEWKPGQMIGKSEGQPAWAASIGVELGELTPGKEESLPEWLSGVSPEKPVEATTEEFQPSSPAFSLDSLGEIPAPGQPEISPTLPTSSASDEEMPDWMKAIGDEISSDEAAKWEGDLGPMKGEEATPIEAEEVGITAAEIPDWLRAMAPVHGLEGASEIEKEISSWEDEVSSQGEAEAALGKMESTEKNEGGQEAEEMPDWMTTDKSPIHPSGGDDDISKLPDWLTAESELPEYSSEEIAGQEEAIESKETTPEGELPAWLFEGEGSPTEAPATEGLEVSTPSAPSEIPSDQTETKLSDLEIPDWLLESEAANTEDLPSKEEIESVLASTAETGEPGLAFSSEEEAAWLAEEESTTESTPQEETSAEDIGDEIPDWLKEISVASAVDVPEWLLEEEAPQSKTPPIEAGVSEQTEPSTLFQEEIQETEEEKKSIGETQPAQAVSSEEIFVSTPETIEPAIEGIAAETPIQEFAPQEDREEIFAWLEDMTANKEESAAPPISEPETPVVEIEPPVSLTEDEAAFAWLEGLAVKQGAEEALLLKPEERLDVPPEWIQRSIEEGTVAEIGGEETPSIEEVVTEETTPSTVPLEREGEIEPEKPEVEITERTPGAPGLIEEPTLFVEEILQSESPATIELETLPEAELETGIETAPATLPEVELERILRSEPETMPEEELEVMLQPEPETMPEEELEAIPQPELEAAISPETIEIVEQIPIPLVEKINLNQASLAELERLPGVGFITAQRIIDFRETNGPFAGIDDLLNMPDFTPDTLEEIKDLLYIEVIEIPPAPPITEVAPITEEGEFPIELGQAQETLIKGNLEQALEEYDRLIQSGQALPEIIRDLEKISRQYPQEIQVWQKLGDAYLRSDQLPLALNAYVEAERLL